MNGLVGDFLNYKKNEDIVRYWFIMVINVCGGISMSEELNTEIVLELKKINLKLDEINESP